VGFCGGGILWNEREYCETQQSSPFEAVKGLLHRRKAYSPNHKHFTLLPLVRGFSSPPQGTPLAYEESHENLIYHLIFFNCIQHYSKAFSPGG
jgi:hypothetical protein